jgi:acetylornithine deacetylase/succinyl-diaminopimelate desuccinylase-like protein
MAGRTEQSRRSSGTRRLFVAKDTTGSSVNRNDGHGPRKGTMRITVRPRHTDGTMESRRPARTAASISTENHGMRWQTSRQHDRDDALSSSPARSGNFTGASLQRLPQGARTPRAATGSRERRLPRVYEGTPQAWCDFSRTMKKGCGGLSSACPEACRAMADHRHPPEEPLRVEYA